MKQTKLHKTYHSFKLLFILRTRRHNMIYIEIFNVLISKKVNKNYYYKMIYMTYITRMWKFLAILCSWLQSWHMFPCVFIVTMLIFHVVVWHSMENEHYALRKGITTHFFPHCWKNIYCSKRPATNNSYINMNKAKEMDIYTR